MILHRPASISAALFCVFLVFSAPAAADGRTATDVVRGFQDSLLEVMKSADELGVAGRFDALKPILTSAFNMPVMVATAAGPFWRAAGEDERQRLIAAFRRMSVASVATLFDSYDGETFRVVRERETGGPTLLVDTQIVRVADTPIDISYVTVRLQDRWWIIDVIVAGGISELTVRRSEYLALLRAGGAERLIAALERQADRLIAGQEEAGPAGAPG